MFGFGEKVYKVTATEIGKTKRNFGIYKIQLNNDLWATKLIPLRTLDKKYSKLYQLYSENNKSLDFLVGKYISISKSKNEYGYEFGSIGSFDVLKDFKDQLDNSAGNVFSTNLPIYDFLVSIKRPIESDGSIKIVSDFGDMRVSKFSSVSVCYKFDPGDEKLNFGNIEKIFKKFYEGVDLPVYTLTGDGDGQKSYYKISWQDAAIVRMDNHVRVSYKMTTSGDYNSWIAKTVQKIGDELPDDQVKFLKESR